MNHPLAELVSAGYMELKWVLIVGFIVAKILQGEQPSGVRGVVTHMEACDKREEKANVVDGNLALDNNVDVPRSISEASVQHIKLNAGKRGNVLYFVVKRCFDFLSSLIVSAVLLIPLAALALLIVVKDFGNPFYVQKRVGQNGTELLVAKLRSMKKRADHLEDMLTPEQLKEYYREYKLNDDPRLIGYKNPGDSSKCFGGFIRKTSIDELPQIVWNICIKGDMSVVGPRPILRDELEENYTPGQQAMLLSVKPGLTGYWQAYARNNATYETGERQRMELYYVQNQSLWLDIKILFATIGAVLRKRGAK